MAKTVKELMAAKAAKKKAAAFASDFNAYSEPFNTRLYKQPGLFWGIVEGRNTEGVVVATKAPSHEEEQKERSKQ